MTTTATGESLAYATVQLVGLKQASMFRRMEAEFGNKADSSRTRQMFSGAVFDPAGIYLITRRKD